MTELEQKFMQVVVKVLPSLLHEIQDLRKEVQELKEALVEKKND